MSWSPRSRPARSRCRRRYPSPARSSSSGTAPPSPPPGPTAGDRHRHPANELGGQHCLRRAGLLPPGFARRAAGGRGARPPGPRAGHRPLVQRHGRLAGRPGQPGRTAAGGGGRLGRRPGPGGGGPDLRPPGQPTGPAALRNLASLPHISVAGACATGTHGSGWANQNLSAAVTGLELVTADGDIVELNRGDGAFDGAVVHLGALGAVTRLILELVPSFEVRQRVYEDLPLDVLDDHFAEIMAGGYSVSMFTDWRAPRLTQLWIKSLAEDGTPPVTEEPWFTAPPAPTARNPVPGLPAANSTAQLGEPGPWFERLPHFRPEFTPSAGDELQSEYLLPAEHAVDAVHALQRAGDRIAPLLRIGEIRTIAGDELWLSPAYRQDSVAFHFTWLPDI